MENFDLLARLMFLEDEGNKWVCTGSEPHGHAEPRMEGGKPRCRCGAESFVRIDEAIRRTSRGEALAA